MDTMLAATTATILAVAVLAPVGPAHAADAAPKQADRVTVGATSVPDRTPADPRAALLTRVAGTSRAATEAPALATKPEPFGTALPASDATLSIEQRAKFAAGIAAAPPAIESERASGAKPAEVFTITPPAAGVQAPIDDRTKHRSLPIETPSEVRTQAGHRNGALGLIPRPEWTAHATPSKAEEVSTLGTAATTLPPVPTAAELQRRAAPTAGAPGASKAPDVSTSMPRDAAAPPARADKNRPARRATSEVRP